MFGDIWEGLCEAGPGLACPAGFMEPRGLVEDGRKDPVCTAKRQFWTSALFTNRKKY